MPNEFVRRVSRIGYGFTFFLLLMELVMLCMKCPAVSWLAIVILLGLFISHYILRELTNRVWVMVLWMLLVCVGIWFLPEIMLQKLLLIGINIGLSASGILYLSRGGVFTEFLDIPWPIILLAVISTGAGLYYEIPLLIRLSVWLSIANIFFFLLIRYSDNIGIYRDAMREVKGLPIRKMLRINSWIVTGIFLLIGIAILLGEALGIPTALSSFLEAGGEFLKGLFYGLVLLVKWFLSLFGGSSSESIAQTEADLEGQLEKTGSFSGVIFLFLKIFLLVIIVVVFLRLLISFLKLLLVRFQRNGKEEIIENTRQDAREFLPDRGLLKKLKQRISPEERARRIYRKRILAAVGKEVPTMTDTTADIRERLSEGGKAFPELTRLYEAVRYGNAVVDSDYLRQMKKADTAKTS